jgi:hypothetical protein
MSAMSWVAAALSLYTLAQTPREPPPAAPALAVAQAEERGGFVRFLGGAAFGLGLHESGHLVFDCAFDAHPRAEGVSFSGIPFFAINHDQKSPREDFTIASAGFWVQNAGNEWILTRHPALRTEHAPFTKGIFAFNVLSSVAYAGAAFASAGPVQRDTRGMSRTTGIDEPLVGVLVLAPAALDLYRYYHPEAGWARWASRLIKIGMLLLVLK